MGQSDLVLAAGAVVLDRVNGDHRVLLVHRPKYDDWSLPKGKLDPGEDIRSAAVREVLEETGVHVRLGPPIGEQVYTVAADGGRTKRVSYWVGRPNGGHDVSTYSPNGEVDSVRWVPADEAAASLTYARDRDLLRKALRYRRRTLPLVVLRHAEALDRKRWSDDDSERPLTTGGEQQADRLIPLLTAYGARRLVSSSSRRCWTTVAPYGRETGQSIEVTDALSEEDATPRVVADEIEELLEGSQPTVVCTHRKVLPFVYDALGVDDAKLEKGAFLVVHHRRGAVVAVEEVPAPPPGS